MSFPTHDSPAFIPNLNPFSFPSEIKFLWVHSLSSLYSKLSFNLVREIVSYLSYSKKPIAILEKSVQFFDIETYRWSRLYTLDQELPLYSSVQATFTYEDSVFVCGRKFLHYETDAYFIEEGGKVNRLPKMRISRESCGIVYSASSSSIYLFGGISSDYLLKNRSHNLDLNMLQSCERFGLRDWTWEMIPSMQNKRMYFTPCEHLNSIYLPGGHNSSMEIYTPKLNEFRVLPEFDIPETTPCNAVIIDDTLIVMSESYIIKWSFSKEIVTSIQKRRLFPLLTSCSPVVSAGRIYMVTLNKQSCVVVNLEFGLMEGRVSEDEKEEEHNIGIYAVDRNEPNQG